MTHTIIDEKGETSSGWVHKGCSTFPAFEFQARPEVAFEDAVRVEPETIAWRDVVGYRFRLSSDRPSAAPQLRQSRAGRR